MDDNWLKENAQRLYAYARARLSDQEEIKDVIQETLLAAIKSKDNFRGESEQYTWIIGILRHKIHDVYRIRARQNKYLITGLESSDGSDFKENLEKNIADKNPGPDRLAEKNLLYDELNICIDNLPEPYRSAVRMRELDNMNTKEICNVLGISSTNLNVILYRARVKLKRCLENKGIRSVE